MRIAFGGILHETATFIDRPTTLADFSSGFGLFRGEAMFQRFTGANLCPGGHIEAAKRHGFELVPLLWAFAYPSGLIERAAYDTLKQEFLDRLREADAAEPLDGVLLDLHGAMVVEGIDDGDGDMIESVRAVVGPKRPIIVTTDLHGNHTPRRVAAADAILGYDTYPHVDMAARGSEAGDLIVRIVRGEVRPRAALRQIPIFWPTATQVTAHPPMDEVMRRVHEMESRPGMLSVTIATGFAWADVPDVGTSVIAVADGDALRAQRAADELGDWIWENRMRWFVPPVPVKHALAEGQKRGRYPIFLADHADNTGGGAAGDSTEILHTFRELGLRDALLLYLVDPEVALEARRVGVGGRLRTKLGGKSSPVQGPPLDVDAEILSVSDGDFAYDGPMYAGLTGNMGPSACLRFDGITVVVVTAREQPLDPAFARTLGVDCTQMKYVAVKSAAHFRSGFERLAGSIFNVDARAVLTHDLKTLPYRKRTRKMFPIEIPPMPSA
jgi:microcystin degradation protein MlrC